MLSVSRLSAALEILIKGHPSAIRILTGESEPPTVKEISDMVNCLRDNNWLDRLGCRVDSKRRNNPIESAFFAAESYLGIIEKAGGWEHIVKVTRDYITHYPQAWGIFCDYVIYIEGQHARTETRQAEKIADKYGVSDKTVTRRRKQVIPAIAANVILLSVGWYSQMSINS